MLTSGDVIELDLGLPIGHEAGFSHPAVVVTAQKILAQLPDVVHVVPLTSTLRGFASEVVIDPDPSNGLKSVTSAQCHQIRAVSARRVQGVRGNVGVVLTAQIRELIGLILDTN